MSRDPSHERDLENIIANIQQSKMPHDEKWRRERLVRVARILLGKGRRDESRWPVVEKDYRPLHKRI